MRPVPGRGPLVAVPVVDVDVGHGEAADGLEGAPDGAVEGGDGGVVAGVWVDVFEDAGGISGEIAEKRRTEKDGMEKEGVGMGIGGFSLPLAEWARVEWMECFRKLTLAF